MTGEDPQLKSVKLTTRGRFSADVGGWSEEETTTYNQHQHQQQFVTSVEERVKATEDALLLCTRGLKERAN